MSRYNLTTNEWYGDDDDGETEGDYDEGSKYNGSLKYNIDIIYI